MTHGKATPPLTEDRDPRERSIADLSREWLEDGSDRDRIGAEIQGLIERYVIPLKT